MRSREGKLSTKITLPLLAAMLLILIVTTIILFKNTKMTVEQTISNFSINTAKNIAAGLDTDTFEQFLNSPSESAEYWKLREQLGDYQTKTGAAYVYILNEKNKEITILVDGSAKEAEDAAEIGAPTTGTSFADVEPAIKGGYSSTGIVDDPEYGKYLSAFAPIKNKNNEIIGLLGVDIMAEDVGAIQNNVISQSLPVYLAVLLLLIAGSSVLLFFYTKKRLAPLSVISKTAREIQDGDLEKAEQLIDSLAVKGNDEIKHVADSFQSMTHRIKTLLAHIADISDHLVQTSDQLASDVHSAKGSNQNIFVKIDHIADGSRTNLQQSEESVTAMEEMAIGIQRIADSSASVSESSNDVTKTVEQSDEDISKVIAEIQEVESSITETANKLRSMIGQVEEISQITKVITDISNQTNLLALNAAIEATRAGEHGKGFAVVAEEVRKLAEKSRFSAEEISRLITGFTAITRTVIVEMNESTAKAHKGTEAVEHTGKVFNGILDSVQKVNEEIQEVSAVTEQLSAGSEEIFASLEQFSQITKQTANDTIDVADASKEELAQMDKIEETTKLLKQFAEQLEQSIAVFK
ncbi:methyl-accepting chemotaxis protein [Bacillus badius]|nr:methyl-accepting chemotaxis protein [Bacillus badius]MED0665560.1 methyl-accepting chemotaxis protein [Bacillus badius]